PAAGGDAANGDRGVARPGDYRSASRSGSGVKPGSGPAPSKQERPSRGPRARRSSTLQLQGAIMSRTLAVFTHTPPRWAGLVLCLLAGITSPASSQQGPDSSFTPALGAPAFAPGAGPLIVVDQGHQNFHTLGGRFYAFGRLAASDGFVVRPGPGRITGEALA